MGHKVTLKKDVPLNGKTYPKGSSISVSDSIHAALVADDAIEKPGKTEDKK